MANNFFVEIFYLLLSQFNQGLINNYRQSGYEDDLHNNMIWAATVVLCLTILGRYIIKFGNWVADNKTEQSMDIEHNILQPTTNCLNDER